jgi:hypothetical protein
VASKQCNSPWEPIICLFLRHNRSIIPGGRVMQDVNYLRDLARHCRALLKTAKEPEVIDQLRVWAVDFADEADDAERRAGEREEVQVVGFGERT